MSSQDSLVKFDAFFNFTFMIDDYESHVMDWPRSNVTQSMCMMDVTVTCPNLVDMEMFDYWVQGFSGECCFFTKRWLFYVLRRVVGCNFPNSNSLNKLYLLLLLWNVM